MQQMDLNPNQAYAQLLQMDQALNHIEVSACVHTDKLGLCWPRINLGPYQVYLVRLGACKQAQFFENCKPAQLQKQNQYMPEPPSKLQVNNKNELEL